MLSTAAATSKIPVKPTDRQFLRSGRLYIDRMARPPTEKTGGFDCDLCVCQRISDGLMFDDGINAAAPFGGLAGEKLVNVLEVNLALRQKYGAPQ